MKLYHKSVLPVKNGLVNRSEGTAESRIPPSFFDVICCCRCLQWAVPETPLLQQ